MRGRRRSGLGRAGCCPLPLTALCPDLAGFEMAKKLGPNLYPLEPEEIEKWKIRIVEQELADEHKVKLEERKPKLEKREW